MQLSHGNGLSAVFYFFYGIEITDVLLCANEGDPQQSKRKGRMQGLWVRPHVQTRSYCSVCNIKKGKSWVLLRHKGAAERWRASYLPPGLDAEEAVSIPMCLVTAGWGREELLGSLVSLVLSWAMSHALNPSEGGVTSLPNVLGTRVLPEHRPLCPAEQSPAGRGGRSMVSGVFLDWDVGSFLSGTFS